MMSMLDDPNTLSGGEESKALSFEEFSKSGGNFSEFFSPLGSMTGDIYRNQAVYQDCLAEHPELEALAIELRDYDFEEFHIDEKTGEVIKDADPKRGGMMQKLYQAYLIMRPYAKDDRELFR